MSGHQQPPLTPHFQSQEQQQQQPSYRESYDNSSLARTPTTQGGVSHQQQLQPPTLPSMASFCHPSHGPLPPQERQSMRLAYPSHSHQHSGSSHQQQQRDYHYYPQHGQSQGQGPPHLSSTVISPVSVTTRLAPNGPANGMGQAQPIINTSNNNNSSMVSGSSNSGSSSITSAGAIGAPSHASHVQPIQRDKRDQRDQRDQHMHMSHQIQHSHPPSYKHDYKMVSSHLGPILPSSSGSSGVGGMGPASTGMHHSLQQSPLLQQPIQHRDHREPREQYYSHINGGGNSNSNISSSNQQQKQQASLPSMHHSPTRGHMHPQPIHSYPREQQQQHDRHHTAVLSPLQPQPMQYHSSPHMSHHPSMSMQQQPPPPLAVHQQQQQQQYHSHPHHMQHQVPYHKMQQQQQQPSLQQQSSLQQQQQQQQQQQHHVPPHEYQQRQQQSVHHHHQQQQTHYQLEHRKSFSGSSSAMAPMNDVVRRGSFDDRHEPIYNQAPHPAPESSSSVSMPPASLSTTATTPITVTTAPSISAAIAVSSTATPPLPSASAAYVEPAASTLDPPVTVSESIPLQSAAPNQRQKPLVQKQKGGAASDSLIPLAAMAHSQSLPPPSQPQPQQEQQQPQQKKPAPPKPKSPVPTAPRRPIGRPRGSTSVKAEAAQHVPVPAPTPPAAVPQHGASPDQFSEMSDESDRSDAEMTFEQIQKDMHHGEVDKRLQKLESYFSDNKNEIYEDKIDSFLRETKELRLGTHPDFMGELRILEEERDAALRAAELFRDYELECAQRIYQLEYDTSLAEYTTEKAGLGEKMLQELYEKKRKLKEERDGFDVSNDATLEVTKSIGIRKAARLNPGRSDDQRKVGKRSKVSSGPVLVFQLKDHEIYEDLGNLRRNVNVRKAAANYKNRKQ
ncbi:hypothetical protein BASA50_010098 [Batrachochytrium salamandrivorans]|uniref:Sds3-like-domain-containing protein n=1 Tax=Batrachochytrium salamandrivorans TaxID=1357716 RepID=A0ABQ8EZH0_9FUNG|nr:hypothetical protein BASA50_010098 [Batrachochytrium salamandrivorans]